YSVRYTSEEGCVGTATSDVLLVTTTGLEMQTSNTLVAWPNPADGPLFLRGLSSSGTVNITIVDAMGRTVATQNMVGPSAHIDTMPLQSGVYWLRVSDGAGQQVLRFVKR
ncbi:MAG TPA: T9SS type A sorting domain-containing protein, partial [Flavobacteriales bacterium]|nr:T9SS type A sorting domain-containing protein [Flavobacteriales bacterium]